MLALQTHGKQVNGMHGIDRWKSNNFKNSTTSSSDTSFDNLVFTSDMVANILFLCEEWNWKRLFFIINTS